MKRKRRAIPWRAYAFGCLLGIAVGLGGVYGAFRLQHTYVLVELADLQGLIQHYNELLMQCFSQLRYFHNS